MSKWMARVLALICTLGTCFLLFQARFMENAEGERVFLFSVPGSIGVDSGSAEELRSLMTRKLGQAGPLGEPKTVTWKDQEATVQDVLTYELEDLGRTFGEEKYIQCIARTTRTVTASDGKALAVGTHDLSFLARDPAGEDRAYIFWDTKQESYNSSLSYFEGLLEGK